MFIIADVDKNERNGGIMDVSKERNRQIYEERLKGTSYSEIAKIFSISTGRARAIFENEKKKEERNNSSIFKLLCNLTDNEQLAVKTLTVLKRNGADTKEEIAKLDRKTLKRTRHCGIKMENLIIRAIDEINKNDVMNE